MYSVWQLVTSIMIVTDRRRRSIYNRVSQPESADSFESVEGFDESASTTTSFKITSTSFNDKTL